MPLLGFGNHKRYNHRLALSFCVQRVGEILRVFLKYGLPCNTSDRPFGCQVINSGLVLCLQLSPVPKG